MEIFYCIIFLVFQAQANAKTPHFTFSQKRLTEAFYGESVNFTWTFSDHPLYRGTFGLFHIKHKTIITQLLSIDMENGTFKFASLDGKDAKPYKGRVRGVGDMASRTLSVELSNIQYSDNTYYGMELEFEDDDFTMIENYTQLIVKVPSAFTSSPGTLSLLRGKTAQFPWKYHLNDEDKKLLTKISFGVYRKNNFNVLCTIMVNPMKSDCSQGKAKMISLDMLNSATFEISGLELKDEAMYALRLEGTQRPMENRSSVIVQDPPAITENPKSLTVKEYETFSLNCAASGKPTPMITWYKDGQVIQEQFNGSYIVNYTYKEDAGKYHCVAGNEVGNATSSMAKVDVQYSPIINTTSKFSMKHAPIGRTVQLKCHALANPPAKVKWYIHNLPNSRYTGQVLEIKIRNKHDYGNYTCQAKNSLGTDQAKFMLEHVGPPSTPTVDCEKQGSRSRVTVFRWSVPEDDGGAPVLAYMVKRREIFSSHNGFWVNANVSYSKTWLKVPVNWETTVEFTITAWNKYGESKLDLDNTCIYSIGKDPSLITTASTARTTVKHTATVNTVAAAAYNGSEDNQKIMVYVGICIALLALIAVVILLIAYRVKKNKTKKDNWTNHQNLSYDRVLSIEGASATDSLLGSSLPRTRKQTMVGSPSFQFDPNWNIPREKICIMKVIGNGAFGLVYKGRVHGVGSNTVGWNVVAIKSPYADATDAEVRDLMKEFELLKTLKPHPHVIKLLGCGEDEGRPLVIIEYVPFGDLLGYLRKSHGQDDDYYSDPEIKPNTNLSSQQLIRFAWHVADGMAYLAFEKIIHRDLAARNVLVGEGLSCKVTDFGMARDVSNDDIYLRTTEGRLPVKWTAIEALTGSGEYTTQSDVWSFGVVLYEICTIGADPYPGINGKEIPERLDTGYRMPRPGHVDPELYDIMMSCWKTEPEERPTFPELKEKLVKLEAVQSRDYINLSECLYQNVTVNGSVSRGPKRRSLLELAKGLKKDQPKGNDYHEGLPGGHRHIVTAV